MAFFKFRQRGQPPAEPRGRAKEPAAAGTQETIDSMRRRARHRLLGAAVLVLVAVVGFPILFDTQPRPVVVDAPITIPDKDQVAPLGAPTADRVPATASLGDREEVVATAPVAASAASPVVAPKPAPTPPAPTASAPAKPAEPARETTKPDPRAEQARAAEEVVAARAKREQEAQAQAKRDLEVQARREQEAKAKREQEVQAKREQDVQAKREQDAQAKREQDAQAKREQEARAKREAEAQAKRKEAERARALLEGRGQQAAAAAPAASDSGRFIVQIGAYADAEGVRQVRQQAERAGLRTYTQVVNTAQGQRTRVRVGPFGTRADADKAAAALKKAGLAGTVLSL